MFTHQPHSACTLLLKLIYCSVYLLFYIFSWLNCIPCCKGANICDWQWKVLQAVNNVQMLQCHMWKWPLWSKLITFVWTLSLMTCDCYRWFLLWFGLFNLCTSGRQIAWNKAVWLESHRLDVPITSLWRFPMDLPLKKLNKRLFSSVPWKNKKLDSADQRYYYSILNW